MLSLLLFLISTGFFLEILPDGSLCVSFESFAYHKLGYEDAYELGPREIVALTRNGYETVSPAGEEMKICGFLWTYYGYPNSNYEGVNVEVMRYHNGDIMARQELAQGRLPDVDYVAGVPDSGVPHAIGYANRSGKPFARPFVKYTPTWPRSFTPDNQEVRNQVAKMKQIPVSELIEGKKLLFVDDSIVRGTQLRETVDFLYESGAKEVHMRSACPPIMYSCKYLNFSRGNSDMELLARRVVQELEGDEGQKHLDEYADAWADRFPEAYVKFKQLDYQNVPSLEFRFYGSDIDSLRAAADGLMARMRRMPELQWVHSDYEDPRSVIDVRLDPVTAPQLGVTRTLAAVNLALASGDVPVGSVWEGDYRLPIVLKNDTRQGQRSLSDIGDTYISSPVPSVSMPLRQIADVEPVWSQSKIVHRNGMRCITVTADLKRGANAMRMTSRISDIIDRELVLPAGVTTELGGAHEFDWETIPPIASGLSISLVIIFFFILVNFRKFGITLVVMASMSLCLFGAVVGLRIADFTIGLTSVLGFITLLGMIVRNVILMYQLAEDNR